MKIDQAQRYLASVIGRLARDPDVKRKLAEMKRGSVELKRRDFVWHKLLTSFATLGNSRGAEGLIRTRSNYNRLAFLALGKKTKAQRMRELRLVLHKAKVRMPDKKAVWLSKDYDLINEMGGLRAAKQELLRRNGREAKIEFWKEFYGIGPKYARNIMMDVYHPEFHNSIAVDQRIKGISRILGLEFRRYEDEESFYLEAAKLAKIDGWDLDRIIYWFRDQVETSLRNSLDVRGTDGIESKVRHYSGELNRS
jgi:hypothetical protein